MTDTIYIQPAPRKSMLAALVLTLFLGPVGLFYASVVGGVLMTVLFFISLLLSLVTLGLLGFLPLFLWFGSMLWAALAVDSLNKAPPPLA